MEKQLLKRAMLLSTFVLVGNSMNGTVPAVYGALVPVVSSALTAEQIAVGAAGLFNTAMLSTGALLGVASSKLNAEKAAAKAAANSGFIATASNAIAGASSAVVNRVSQMDPAFAIPAALLLGATAYSFTKGEAKPVEKQEPTTTTTWTESATNALSAIKNVVTSPYTIGAATLASAAAAGYYFGLPNLAQYMPKTLPKISAAAAGAVVGGFAYQQLGKSALTVLVPSEQAAIDYSAPLKNQKAEDLSKAQQEIANNKKNLQDAADNALKALKAAQINKETPKSADEIFNVSMTCQIGAYAKEMNTALKALKTAYTNTVKLIEERRAAKNSRPVHPVTFEAQVKLATAAFDKMEQAIKAQAK